MAPINPHQHVGAFLSKRGQVILVPRVQGGAEDDPTDLPAKDEPLGDGGKKALEAERAARKKLEDEIKALRPLAEQAKKAEDDKKGEVERLTEQLAAVTRERDDATSTATRYKVGLEKGLSLSRTKRLVGANEEEFAADADELLADLGEPERKTPAVQTRPTERLRGGGEPDEAPEETDPAKLAADVPRS